MGLVCLVSACAHTAAPPSAPSFQPPVLRAVVKGSLSVDASALPAEVSPYSVDGSYQGLTEADCPRLAARASILGNLLDQKAQAPSPSSNKCRLRAGNSSELSCVVLQQAAVEARSRSAGDALEAFYRLIEAEQGHALLLLSMREVNESLLRAGELEAKGLPALVRVIRKKLTDLHSDEVRLRITILQLNTRLKVLLGLSSGDYSLWPMADLKVVPEEPDVDGAVADGLQHRPDLALLKTLAYYLDHDSLAVAGQALGAVSAFLGESSSPSCCASLLARSDDCQTQWTQQQLQSLLAERQRQATEEIRQAVSVVVYRAQLVILARQEVEMEERQIRELEEKSEKGLDAEEELSTARLKLNEAQGELLHEVINWKIARAQLRQAQGRLLEEVPWTEPALPGVAPN
jgi:hypothetical protein